MAVYQVKRLVRNRAVPFIAPLYEWTIRTSAARLEAPTSPDQVPLELAIFIGAFYQHTDDEMLDAARGRFTILGRTVDFGSIAGIDWSYQQPDENDGLWRMKLAQLGILHSLIASGDPAHQKTAIALLSALSQSRSFASRDAFAIGWSPYDASHRLMALLSGLSIAVDKASISNEIRTALEAFAQLDAACLWANIEHEMRNNHTERNLAALCFYHLAAGSISRRRAKLLDRDVAEIISSTVLPDGMQVERSAMYQGLTVMSLRIFAACPFLSTSTRTLASERADAAASAWLFLTHRDGEIALFNDSWIGEVPAPAALLNLDPMKRPAALPSAGYFRISSGSVEAIMDAGQIGPRWNPAHGHPDFLALEVDVAGRRLVVDPGTSQYSPGPQRAYERSTAAHNGPHYRGLQLVEYSGRFKVGKLTQATPLDPKYLSDMTFPVIGGQVTTEVGWCARVVCALPSGGLLVIDQWESAQPPGASNLLIPSEWLVDTEEPAVVRARFGDVETDLVIYHGRLATREDKTWSRHYFQTEKATSLQLEPARDSGGNQRLVFGIGVVDSSEVASARVQAETLDLRGRTSMSARP